MIQTNMITYTYKLNYVILIHCARACILFLHTNIHVHNIGLHIGYVYIYKPPLNLYNVFVLIWFGDVG